jgi:gliding motility-associated-like protein
MKPYFLYACLASILLLKSHNSFSIHIRAGEIVVKQSNCQDGVFFITLIMYGSTASPIKPGFGILNFGDGSTVTTPLGNFEPRSDLDPLIGVYLVSLEHKYSQPGIYVVSYLETNRNSVILNIQNSGDTPFFIETVILFDKQMCNNSPKLLAPPIDQACSRLIFFHNPGAFDEDGDSLSFRIVTPLAAKDQPANYLSPNHTSFYTNFNAGNEAGNGPPQFAIDALKGTITWDAPGAIGEYNIAFVVEEWRKVNNRFVKLGSVRRDMQIDVIECNNKRPDLIIPKDICVLAGTTINEKILGSDPDLNDVKIEVFSGIFSLPNNPASFSPSPPMFQTSKPSASLSFLWTPSCEEVRNQPYQITIKITDNPAKGPRLVRFKTWNIKVATPPPVFTKVELDIVNKKAELAWSPYTCANAIKIQIWRRVGSFLYNPDDCVSGLPKFAGYSKIAEVSPNDVKFIDDNDGLGLAVGAVYCYRLTALFPLVGGAESKVSSEMCLPPILADAPVITHVSVDKTDEQLGEIIVSWKSPYDLKQSEFLKPYEYALWRSKGLTGASTLTKINSSNILDTTFTDKGINTKDFPYNYRIVLLARSSNDQSLISIDTSSVSSSVWNAALPQLKSIELNWQAVTPWSNVIQDNPWHLIYRGDERSGNNLTLIDSVNVLENGFYYIDAGEFGGKGLNESEFYCYRIQTRGTYGNPSIPSPLKNFSQIGCSTTLDIIPPCKPIIVQTEIDCDLFNSQTPCSQKTFSNKVEWLEPIEEPCRSDAFSYRVYGANSTDEEFELLGSTSGTEFIETGLIKLSRCYQIKALDRAGNESELSDVVCYDNCPSVFIPNVITPNGDEYNEEFAIFETDENCSRFVDHVTLSVFNRWGQKVISIENTGSLLWDGNDYSGKPVSAGVYYFNAEVSFDAQDPSKSFKQIKGWLHVVY